MSLASRNMFSVTSSKSSETTATDMASPSPSVVQQNKIPKWITDFNMKCLEICSTTCSEKLDEIMALYIKDVERVITSYGPGNASVVANRMSRTMLFFYLKYIDIKEFIVISQWNEHMVDLLTLYCQLELRASQIGNYTHTLICSRIMNALWTYLNSDETHMLHVILKIPVSKKHEKILDPIFRKLLIGKKKPEDDLEYIRKILAFKLMKRLYDVEKKKTISELAYNELKAPKSFMANYWRYYFLPQDLDTSDIHRALITKNIDIYTTIGRYFKYMDNNTDECMIESVENPVTSANAVRVVETPLTSVAAVRIIENPSVSVNAIQVDNVIDVIDLTSDPVKSEPEIELQTVEFPQWCANLIQISEQCVPITPPHSTTEEDTPQEIQNLEREISAVTEITETEVSNVENSTQIEKQIIIDDENKTKLSEPTPPLEVTLPIPNARIERLDSDSVDLTVPGNSSNNTSEDNSHGFREITSTSHPVKDVTETNSCPSPTPEHTVNHEQVDSTSNLNENEEMETSEPITEQFILDTTVSKNVDTLSEVQVSATVSNVDFEQFACGKTQDISCFEQPISDPTSSIEQTISDPILSIEQLISDPTSSIEPINDQCTTDGEVSDLNIVSVIHVSDENSIEKTDAFNITYVASVIKREEQSEPDTFDPELDASSEDNVQSKTSEDDLQSPDFEPITQNDCADYAKRLDTSQYYESFCKDVENTRKRKKSDISPQVARTNTKRVSISKSVLPIQEELIPEIVIKPSETEERRVPLSGEKVFRFAGLWESVFTDKFKVSKLDFELFNPNVVVKKLNPQHFVPNYNEYATTIPEEPTPIPYYSQTVDYSHRSNLYLSRYHMKGILERQEYMKPNSNGERPRARIIQINRKDSNSSQVHKELNSTTSKKKKGSRRKQLHSEEKIIKKKKYEKKKATPIRASPISTSLVPSSTSNDQLALNIPCPWRMPEL